ncbi:MAG: leucine-rich repeat protein [Prevotella sp.]|nr:leucine-rich repeat protein [Prevotella sp.]
MIGFVGTCPSHITVPSIAIYEHEVWNEKEKKYETVKDKYNVVGIGNFRNQTALVSVTANSVTSIIYYAGYGAFQGCTSLKTASFNSAKTIGSSAFSGCTSLTSINVGAVKEIGTRAFYGCENLTSFTANSLTEIPGDALGVFQGCTNLKTVSISSAKEIGQNAFSGCTSLASVNVGSAESIGYSAFEGCTSLTSINVGAAKTIGGRAFYGCTSLTTAIIGSTETIGVSAFSGCTSLTSINVGSVKTIGNNAFYGCTSLTTANVSSAESIGNDAFYGCSGLTTINAGAVKEIGTRAFYGCKSLTAFTANALSAIPDADWTGDGVFEGCTSLKTVSISSVKEIGKYAFSGCTSLVSIDLSPVEKIGGSAFYGCTNLLNVTLGNSLKSIGSHAFWKCSEMTTIVIPNSVLTIEDYAFAYCYHLNSLVIGNSVQSIENNAFRSCRALTHIVLPPSLKKLGNSVFYNTPITSIAIPSSVTEIPDEAFRSCSLLKSVDLGSSITTIGEYAFNGCYNLRSITIPASVTKIKDWVFGSSLKEIYCEATTPPTVYDNIGYNGTFSSYDATLMVPPEAENAYRRHAVWGKFLQAKELQVEAKRGFMGEIVTGNRFEATGIAADGLSQVVVYADGPEDLSGASVEFDIDGTICNDALLTGTVGAVELQDNGQWGFVLTAPSDFPETVSGNSYTLGISLKSRTGEGGKVQLNVYRPGVLLVHGLNSDTGCFAELESFLTSQAGYEGWQVLNVNYKSTHNAAFEDNTFTHRVIGRSAEALYNQMKAQGIVSSRYDLIGHSMGGILSRMYAQEVNKDGVNRIITLDTPHSGSQLAYLMKNGLIPAVQLTQYIPNPVLAAAATAFKEVLTGHGQLAAFENLAPTSDAIKRLNGPALQNAVGVPVHAICSYMTPAPTTEEEQNDSLHIYEPSEDGMVLALTGSVVFNADDEVQQHVDKAFLDRLYEDEYHDGVVSFTSQRGGLPNNCVTYESDVYKGMFGINSWAHHCQTNKWSETYLNIQYLLRQPRSSTVFSTSGFRPADLSHGKARSVQTQKKSFKEAAEGQFIKLSAAKEDTMRVLRIGVSTSSDVVANLVFASVGDEAIVSACNQTSYRFRIPDTYEGELVVYAIGRTADNALVADTLVVNYERTAHLAHLLFTDRPSVTMTEGQQREFSVWGGWSNGEESYLQPAYTTSVEGILEVNGQIVTAKTAGECLLIATQEGVADTLRVKVLPQEVTGIREVGIGQPGVSYAHSVLTVTMSETYSGPLALNVYDLTGHLCQSLQLRMSVQAGEPVQFDLSALPSGFYVARVGSSRTSAVCKFHKQ